MTEEWQRENRELRDDWAAQNRIIANEADEASQLMALNQWWMIGLTAFSIIQLILLLSAVI